MALAKALHSLPTTRMRGHSDSHWPDVQAGIEKAMATLIVAQIEADFVTMGVRSTTASVTDTRR
jgi:trimethylamine:corrinoid methyltransferase-like protein